MEKLLSYTVDFLDLNQRPISVDEFHAMGEAGILDEDDRIELIDGRLIVMEPIGLPHANCVIRLNNLLVGRGPYVVSPQNPLRLSDYTEPLPDLVLLPADRDPDGPILGPNSLLVIEVADTSLSYDRGIKLSRYAQAGVPEVWIIDLNRSRIEVYRDLAGHSYGRTSIRSGDDKMPLPGGGEISVADIFPPR
ncbi:MAG: Uma2 family endonuclease [Rhodothermales bacterium]